VDLPVRGARLLAALRAATLLLVLALLFDPLVPLGGARTSSRWVLLDASLSMAAPGAGGETAWEAALGRAGELGRQGWTVARFGAGVETQDPAEGGEPLDARTLLAPALSRAAESGAREVVVLSDLRLEDAVTALASLETLPMDLRFEAVGGTVSNAGALSLEVADRPLSDTPGAADVDVHGGEAGDSLTVEILEEGRAVAARTVPAPGPGLRRSVTVDLPPSGGSGLVRYEARVRAEVDGFPSDDVAVAYASVGTDESGGIVLVSLRPDWEPRSLLPTLQEVTGLPGSGFLRTGPDRFVSMGLAVERGPPVDTARVRRLAAEATLLVVHGVSGEADAWARSLAEAGRRRVLFAADDAGADLLGVPTLPVRRGEWYPSPDLPPSPIAGALAGSIPQTLPPLGNLLVPRRKAGLEPPLVVRLGGTGPAEAPVYLRRDDEGRVAFVLASGFWRWAAREGGRDAYRSLWSGVSGWLLRDESVAGGEIRPEMHVFPRGASVAWRVPAEGAGYRVAVRPQAGGGAPGEGEGPAGQVAIVLDTALATPGMTATGVLPPAAYAYTVSDAEGDSVAGGRFDVAETTEEMLPAPVDADRLEASAGAAAAVNPAGQPLRTMPWPYLLIIVLLSAEWIGRRRSGLR